MALKDGYINRYLSDICGGVPTLLMYYFGSVSNQMHLRHPERFSVPRGHFFAAPEDIVAGNGVILQSETKLKH